MGWVGKEAWCWTKGILQKLWRTMKNMAICQMLTTFRIYVTNYIFSNTWKTTVQAKRDYMRMSSPSTTPILLCKTGSVLSNQPPPTAPSLNLLTQAGFETNILTRILRQRITVVGWMWPWRNSRNQSKPSILWISSEKLEWRQKVHAWVNIVRKECMLANYSEDGDA